VVFTLTPEIGTVRTIPDLPAAVRAIRRIFKNDGVFSVVIPCEGSLATRVARNISARPNFEKLYKQSYDWFINSEHINLPWEIFEELAPYFQIVHRRFYPLFLSITYINLFIGLALKPK
jgi:hypothetical protein